MPPQVVNMELLLSSEVSQQQIPGLEALRVIQHTKPVDPDSSTKSSSLSSHSSEGSLRKKVKRNRRFSLTHVEQKQHPLHVIRTLLFPGGKSMAYCNDETLSSSFLILDGFLTICLIDDKNKKDNASFSQVQDAIERWGKRLETNICVGKVSYEYRLSDEDEKSMSTDSEVSERSNEATILSQNLEKIPLLLDQEPIEDGTMLDPDRYLPPSHRMLADALKVSLLQYLGGINR